MMSLLGVILYLGRKWVCPLSCPLASPCGLLARQEASTHRLPGKGLGETALLLLHLVFFLSLSSL